MTTIIHSAKYIGKRTDMIVMAVSPTTRGSNSVDRSFMSIKLELQTKDLLCSTPNSEHAASFDLPLILYLDITCYIRSFLKINLICMYFFECSLSLP